MNRREGSVDKYEQQGEGNGRLQEKTGKSFLKLPLILLL
jgi:hypothetical protein